MGKLFTFKNKRHIPGWLAWLLAGFLRLYAWTLRVRIEDPENLLQRDSMGPAVIPIWHNRILFPALLLPRRIRSSLSVLISNSRDGEYITTLIRRFGLQVVRGSSSRGGLHAFWELHRAVENGQGVILTVDGPRGPRYTVHAGAAALASRTGAPVIPVVLNASSCWQLHSWDRTQIPRPFSRVVLQFGRAFSLPSDMAASEGCRRIAEELQKITVDPQA